MLNINVRKKGRKKSTCVRLGFLKPLYGDHVGSSPIRKLSITKTRVNNSCNFEKLIQFRKFSPNLEHVFSRMGKDSLENKEFLVVFYFSGDEIKIFFLLVLGIS